MNWNRFYIIALMLMVVGCQSMNGRGTIAKLRHQTIDIKEEKIEGGLEKAMQSYQRFLEKTPDAALAPEAIRRLADLKLEKEYGTLAQGEKPVPQAEAKSDASKMEAPQMAAPIRTAGSAPALPQTDAPRNDEADAAFEERASQRQSVPLTAPDAAPLPEPGDDLEKAGPLEAIALYTRLLNEYPLYDRNDQVLYQMSRAYEELGKIDEAMVVMERLVRQYPQSRYIDEVQFRRAEFFFTRRKYLDAEEAYKAIVDLGKASYYYELALYKLGWTYYKQELYEDAQHRFIALLDHKVSVGYDFEQTQDESERKRTDDTFRVISLGFSNLGGAESVLEYFSQNGKRSYEDSVYSNLAEFYFDKRRYADATAAYNGFVSRNPFHKKAPNFHMRVIEIHTAGGFPSLVLESKKAFATTYGLKAEYWNYFDQGARQDVLNNLKTNLIDLANHYHAAYQKPRKIEEKSAHFKEAQHWYREFLAQFPLESESPAINYQLADLLLQNKDFGLAALEYEKTAYGYPSHEKASEAGYAAVYSHRKHLEATAAGNKDAVKLQVIRSSMTFVETFPQHEKAAIVLGAAAEDLYAMKAYEKALAAGTKLLEQYPAADGEITRTAWLIKAHSSFELRLYKEAEGAYAKVLALLPKGDKTRAALVDNLAASIYKQGEQANAAQDYRAAADHFLRVGRMAPTSTILAAAEYDGAAALIQLKEWAAAATVLIRFRHSFPEHELQPEVTQKIAYVYRENKQLSLAAKEYERIETESSDDLIRSDALQVAAELYAQDGDPLSALAVYRRYVGYFPKPVELHLETRNKIADILKAQNDRPAYLKELKQIVAIEAAAVGARTPRTRYLAGKSALVLAEDTYETFTAVKLVKPIKQNLLKKQKLMKATLKAFNQLVDYELGEVTAAATFYIAEIYAHFSKALLGSERPVLTFDDHEVRPGETLSAIAKQYDADVRRIARENNLNKSMTIIPGKTLKIPRGLNAEELEQYELAMEEQAYPFEDKAIEVHVNNLKLISRGVYNEWIDKSLQKLAVFMPARYAKTEESSAIISSLQAYEFAIARPEPPPLPEPPSAPAETKGVEDASEPGSNAEAALPVQKENPESDTPEVVKQ
jgi:cellulose synthase operon protein C